MLAPEVRAELRPLSRQQADRVACHLVAAGKLVDVDPQLALQHARAARRMAARIGAVREAVGIAAYHASEWAEALTELRAARRLTGDTRHLPLMADCERAMGRPERALRIAQSPEASQLDRAGQVELAMVEAGARRDMGEIDAALVILQGAGLDRSRLLPWSVRLWYAYADTLVAAARFDQAAEWFLAVAGVDTDDQTDAEDRLVELGVLEPDTEPDDERGRDVREGAGADPNLGWQPDVGTEQPGVDAEQPDVGAEDTDAEPLPMAEPAGADATEPPPGATTASAIFREPHAVAEQPILPPPADNSPD